MIPVFYSPNQVVLESVGASPSAGKPASVVASWREKFPVRIVDPTPVSDSDFFLAHDPDHVREVLSCRKANGFGNKFPSVAMSLPFTTGSFSSAAIWLLKNLDKSRVAVSPTSGFHHAGYASCEGFCTFNGLMVTVQMLRERGITGPIGILDLDEHYGNGTVDIIQRLRIPDIVHYTFGGEGYSRGDGERFLQDLPWVMDTFKSCKIILFQAGADPHKNDPYSRGIMSTEQLWQRDRIVFQKVRDMGIPIVWNLAGGYQSPLRKVLDIHDNTMRACAEFLLKPKEGS